MLIPVDLKGKDRKKYVEAHAHQVATKINVGPKAGLRQPKGEKARGFSST